VSHLILTQRDPAARALVDPCAWKRPRHRHQPQPQPWHQSQSYHATARREPHTGPRRRPRRRNRRRK